MRIIHFTLGSVSPDSSNGINRVIEGLAKSMNRLSLADVSVLTVRKSVDRRPRVRIEREGFHVTACNSVTEAIAYLDELEDDFHLVHLHNAWSWANWRIGRHLASRQKPYVITPHAAFLPDRMREKRLRKLAFQRLFQRKLLDGATFLHAVSREEMTSIAEFTSNPRIRFIANGGSSRPTQAECPNASSGRVKCGFIGRISREKNVMGLIRAIAILSDAARSSIQVLIYGDYANEYGRLCKTEVERLALDSVVSFVGPISGEDKWIRLSELDFYIQPSLSEASSIAILEAMSVGLPILATRTCCISYWQGYEFIQMVEPIPDDIARGIELWLDRRGSLAARGVSARRFFDSHLTWERLAKQMVSAYHAINDSGAPLSRSRHLPIMTSNTEVPRYDGSH